MTTTKSSTRTPYQIRHQRTRVALANITVGMTIKHRNRWQEVTYLGDVENNSDGSPFRRYVQTRVTGGSNAGEELEGWLYYNAYEVKPCAALVHPGDVVMLDRKRVTVTSTCTNHQRGTIEISGAYQLHGDLRGTGITRSLRATTPIKVIEWADR